MTKVNAGPGPGVFVDGEGRRVSIAEVVRRLAGGGDPVVLQLVDGAGPVMLRHQAVSSLQRRFNAVAANARISVAVERVGADQIAVAALEPRMTAGRVRAAMDSPPSW